MQPYKKDLNNESVERRFVISAGDPANGSLPRIRGYSDDDVRRVEMMFPLGYYTLPEIDDEVVVLNAFKEGMNRVMVGAVPNFMLNINPGDRVIYSDNAQIILEKAGNITLFNKGATKIQNDGGATILMNEDGTIDLN
jgi:hypothetical protein